MSSVQMGGESAPVADVAQTRKPATDERCPSVLPLLGVGSAGVPAGRHLVGCEEPSPQVLTMQDICGIVLDMSTAERPALAKWRERHALRSSSAAQPVNRDRPRSRDKQELRESYR
jgi:hypothetical protein